MSSTFFPEPFERRMKASLGSEFSSFEEAHHQSSPTSIRLNPNKKITVVAEAIPWTSLGLYLKERPSFTLDPLFHAGAYYVQEASSMFLEQALKQSVPLENPLKVLDLCAAPGGKSTLLASLLNAESLLVSNEVIRSRASILAENLQKWGNQNIIVSNSDPEDFQNLPGCFDVIVIDAPCSGEGLFRKDHEAMNEWSEDNVALCASRQKRIVADVWPALKQNGILIYCTCTYNPNENEDNLKWLKQKNDVTFLKLNIEPSWNIEEIKDGEIFGYRFFPHRVKGEGFFISVIQKREEQVEIRSKNAKNIFAPPSKKVLEQIKHWVKAPEEKSFIQRADVIQFFPEGLAGDVALIAKHLKIIFAGTFLATLKHEKLIPEHSLSLSTEINREHFNNIELSREDALQYLRKETLTIPSQPKGFALITYNNLPLGWVNILENRNNNLYPQEWRIRSK